MILPGVARVREPIIYGVSINKTLYIDSDFLEECANLWATGEFTQLGLESYNNAFKLLDTDFLKLFPQVESIHINLNRMIDLNGFKKIALTLKYIDINDGINVLMDIRPFINLKRLRQKWHEDIIFPSEMLFLEKLGLDFFRPKSADLSSLPNAPNLKVLGLGTGKLRNLSGIERYCYLEEFGLSNMFGLEDVSSMSSLNSLKEVEFESCKGTYNLICGFNSGSLLTKLMYNNCPPLETICFVNKLHYMENLIFLDSSVIDGDFSSLLAHPSLKYVAFTKKKNFSHSDKQVNNVLNAVRWTHINEIKSKETGQKWQGYLDLYRAKK